MCLWTNVGTVRDMELSVGDVGMRLVGRKSVAGKLQLHGRSKYVRFMCWAIECRSV